MDDNTAFNLSSANRQFIVAIVFVGLLLFGPVQPYGLSVRIFYLIGIPAFVWLVLWSWGKRADIDAVTNDRINRALAAGLGGVIAAIAYSRSIAEFHMECDHSVQTRDGYECVGDFIAVNGPDLAGALLLFILAAFAFWYAIARRD